MADESKRRAVLIWVALALVVGGPIIAAAFSPFLAFRNAIYIAASFSGIAALALMVVQPLLIAGALPGWRGYRGLRIHRWIGPCLVIAVVLHVGFLGLTSPPDVLDALLLRSPTSFSVWGVIAMWAVFFAALVALYRHRFRLRAWRLTHTTLVSFAVLGTVLHALLIEGAMEPISKIVLCAAALAALVLTVVRRAPWQPRAPRT